jgi:hypothetical protein
MYLVLYKISNKLECDYIDSITKCQNIINKNNNAYCFRYNRDDYILNLNYPLEFYYSNKKINNYKEEDFDSIDYLEVRLGKNPSIRKAININSIDI